MVQVPQISRISTRSTAPKIPRPVPKPFQCSEADWRRYLYHGSDQINLQRSVWASDLDASLCGELNLNIPLGTLTTPIHDLFHPRQWLLENFPNTTNKWHMIQAALRMATHLLTSPPAMAFFRRVKHGLPRKAGHRVYLQYFRPKDTSTQDAGVAADLLDLARRIKILFGVFRPHENSTAQIHAMHCVSQSEFGEKIFIRGNLNKLPPDDGQTHYLVVNQAYALYASKSDPTPAETVRFVFSLALSLIHETAHAFYAREITDGNEDYVEPYFDLDQQIHDPEKPNSGELGFALEHLMFKHSVQSTIHPTRGVEIEWEPILKSRVDVDVIQVPSHQILPVYTSWLHNFTLQEFWTRASRRADPTETFQIPRAMRGAVIKPKDKKRQLYWAARRSWKWATWENKSRSLKRVREDDEDDDGKKNLSRWDWPQEIETLENYERIDRVNLEIAVGRARKKWKNNDKRLGVSVIFFNLF